MPVRGWHGSRPFKPLVVVAAHVLLLAGCLLSDWLLWSRPLSLSLLSYALLDNTTHATVAAVVWLLAYKIISRNGLTTIPFISFWGIGVDVWALLCALFGSILDADHFVAANSTSLQDATSLTSRPFAHAFTLWLLASMGCILIGRCSGHWYAGRNSALVLFVASWTHLLRDSWRRGLWFWPIGSTPPLPYMVYLALLGVTPLVLVKLTVKEGGTRIDRELVQTVVVVNTVAPQEA